MGSTSEALNYLYVNDFVETEDRIAVYKADHGSRCTQKPSQTNAYDTSTLH